MGTPHRMGQAAPVAIASPRLPAPARRSAARRSRWTLIDCMQPSADVIAAGASNDVGLTKLAPGRQIVVPWRGSPILVVRHTRAMVAPPFAA
jgi:Rieske Fe-S protein